MSPDAIAKTVGTHQLVIEADTMLLVQKGDFTLRDAEQVNAEIEALLTRLGRAFVLVDQSQAGRTPPETRRCIAEWNKKHKASGAVIFGGSTAVRAMATLVVNAIRLFNVDSTETVFTATEAQARQWIAAKRKKLFG